MNCTVNPEHGPARKRGFCNACYLRWWRGKDPYIPVDRSVKLCSVDPQHGPMYARGWCRRCYYRWRKRGGDPAVPAYHGGRSIPLEERIKYRVDPKTGCWVWLRAKGNRGDGRIWVDGRLRLAHRVIYEMHKGPIPRGMQLDHLCANAACVNPDHMEPVTNRQNKLRGGKPHFELRGTA